MLKDKITYVEAQMKKKLDEIRATFTSPGDKGVSVEDIFRKFLREYLSRRLEAGVGEVVDSLGHKSKQTDIVIVNEDHPLTFTKDLPGLFFVEGVSAAGQVKTVLTTKELENTLDNSYSFKQLEIKPGKNTQVSSNMSDLKRFYKCPPFFLVAFDSQLGFPSILKRIEDFLKQKEVGVNEINIVMDAIFILDKGWAINFGDGKGSLQFRNREKSSSVEGWVWQYSETVLFDLLGWLTSVIPKMIRFEPILPLYIMAR